MMVDLRRRLLHIEQCSQAELFALIPVKPMDRVAFVPINDEAIGLLLVEGAHPVLLR